MPSGVEPSVMLLCALTCEMNKIIKAISRRPLPEKPETFNAARLIELNMTLFSVILTFAIHHKRMLRHPSSKPLLTLSGSLLIPYSVVSQTCSAPGKSSLDRHSDGFPTKPIYELTALKQRSP